MHGPRTQSAMSMPANPAPSMLHCPQHQLFEVELKTILKPVPSTVEVAKVGPAMPLPVQQMSCQLCDTTLVLSPIKGTVIVVIACLRREKKAQDGRAGGGTYSKDYNGGSQGEMFRARRVDAEDPCKALCWHTLLRS